MDSPCSSDHFEMRLTLWDFSFRNAAFASILGFRFSRHLFSKSDHSSVLNLLMNTGSSSLCYKSYSIFLRNGRMQLRVEYFSLPSMVIPSSRVSSTSLPKGQLHNQIRLFCLVPPFRLFHRIRLLDFPALVCVWS